MLEQNFRIKILQSASAKSIHAQDVVTKLQQVLTFVKAYDVDLTGGCIAHYELKQVSMNSPVLWEMEPVSKEGTPESPYEVQQKLIEEINSIMTGKPVGRMMSYGVSQKLEIACTFGNSTISEVEIHVGDASVVFNNELRSKIDNQRGDKSFMYGEIVGRLLDLELGNARRKQFAVYSSVRSDRTVCEIRSDEVKEQAKAAIEKRVAVSGILTYRDSYSHPVSIAVDSIEVLPDKEVSLGKILSLDPLPNAFERLREARDGWR